MHKKRSVINVIIILSFVGAVFFAGLHLGGLPVSEFGKLYIKDFLTPFVAFFSTLLAAFMVTETIRTNKKNLILKNTLDAIDHDLYKGEKRIQLERACKLLNNKMAKEHSFKALVRSRTEATRFVNEFINKYPLEYSQIIDALNYADKLCFGVKNGLYYKVLIDTFLGQSVFNVWWAGMILIREKELEFLDDINSKNRSVPHFESPYNNIFTWIRIVANEQNLSNLEFILVKMDTGYKNRSTFKELEALSKKN